MFCPKHLHELALKRIGCYLKQTSDHGMVMNLSSDVCKIDAYPDADFAGMYGHEDQTDPACAQSHTGFIITFAECPMFWQSTFQTETALSTMEAEIIALSACCRELFPIINMVCLLAEATNLHIGNTTMMSPSMKTIQEHWCWLRLCLHSLPLKASVTQSRQFGFVRIFSREISNCEQN